jgi:hypothetical protein
MTDHVEGTAEEIGADLAKIDEDHAAHASSQTLFRTDDPVEVIERATKAADALKKVIAQRGMVQNIQGREHVLVAGWQTLGSMLGVVPVVAWTRPLEDNNGWEARVEARTLDGRTVGAAEAMCTKDERTWKKRDDYALRSMAQTRATSKALRGPLGFIITLAGYSDTPAEEMPSDPIREKYAGAKIKDVEVVGGSDIPPDPGPVSQEVYDQIVATIKEAGATVKPYVETWMDQHGAPKIDSVSLARRIGVMPAALGEELLKDLREYQDPPGAEGELE